MVIAAASLVVQYEDGQRGIAQGAGSVGLGSTGRINVVWAVDDIDSDDPFATVMIDIVPEDDQGAGLSTQAARALAALLMYAADEADSAIIRVQGDAEKAPVQGERT